MTWFRLNIGREKKADPKWLIPEICKQWGITKREIGTIRIFDKETKFEIVEAAAAAFADKVAQHAEGAIRITPAGAPTGGSRNDSPGKDRPGGYPKFKKGPFKKGNFKDRAFKDHAGKKNNFKGPPGKKDGKPFRGPKPG